MDDKGSQSAVLSDQLLSKHGVPQSMKHYTLQWASIVNQHMVQIRNSQEDIRSALLSTDMLLVRSESSGYLLRTSAVENLSVLIYKQSLISQ